MMQQPEPVRQIATGAGAAGPRAGSYSRAARLAQSAQRRLVAVFLRTGLCGVVLFGSLLSTACAGPAAKPPATTPQRRAQLVRRAVEQVLVAARSDDAFLRANAVETAAFIPDRAPFLLRVGVDDKSPVVRFAAMATMGKLRLKELEPSARRLLADPDESVRAAAMFALGQCGTSVNASAMATMLASADPGVRANLALLLGLTRDPSAIPLLKDAAKAPLKRASPQQAALVRLQIAEAVVNLGDEGSIDALEAAAFSQFDEVRVLAVLILGRLEDRRMEPALAGMLDRPPVELQVAAAQALATMGRSRGLNVVLRAAGSATPTVRAQAAIALGAFREPAASDKLAQMLDDPQPQVRIAAAAALLRRARPGAAAG